MAGLHQSLTWLRQLLCRELVKAFGPCEVGQPCPEAHHGRLLARPLVWNSRAGDFARLHNRRQRVFCASLADVFDNQIDPAWRFDLFLLIKQCDQLDWLLLTNRPQNILKMLPPVWGRGYSNVWIGTTAEDQIRFDQRWPYLAAVPSLVRFISYEPAIGALRLNALGPPHPDWIIIGGESGGRSRELDPQSV